MNETQQATLTAADVAQYLAQHPDFFAEHLELLDTLVVPHPSGTAVSLIAKQLALFRNKHEALEEQLSLLVDIARENDQSFSSLHQLTLALLEANTLEQALHNLYHALAEFFDTDFTSLRLIQPPLADTALTDLFLDPNDKQLGQLTEIFSKAQPFCGVPTPAQASLLFGEHAAEVQSCALIPMVYPRLKALLAIGSREADGFHADMGSILLTQISEVVATRLVALLPPSSPESPLTSSL